MATILYITQGGRQLEWDEPSSSQDTAAGTQSRNNRNNRCFGCLSLVITGSAVPVCPNLTCYEPCSLMTTRHHQKHQEMFLPEF